MKVYVASSWRNNWQRFVVGELRQAGHEVYDFKTSGPDQKGFAWASIDPDWQKWDLDAYLRALASHRAEVGFRSDMDAMEWADACVLVMPCGRSAHLELGWFVGRGKPTCIVHTDSMMEPELMTKMVDAQFSTMQEIIGWVDALQIDSETHETKHKAV